MVIFIIFPAMESNIIVQFRKITSLLNKENIIKHILLNQ
nr:MAG TPA: hypothetical protein [Caudoviricetes sp.]